MKKLQKLKLKVVEPCANVETGSLTAGKKENRGPKK